MVRRGDRISRDSARQAMSDVSGREVGSAKTAEAVQADPALAKLAASAEKAAKQIAKNAWQLPSPPASTT